MGRPRAIRMPAALVAACLLAAPASAAATEEPRSAAAGSETSVVATGAGGAAAPTDEPGGPASTGGAEYGAVLRTAAPPRPVATLFSVAPSSIMEGDAPRIRLRIDEAGVQRVAARLVFLPVAGNGELLRVDLGNVATGRLVTASRVGRLAPGRYVVRLHAKDPRGATLSRRAKTSGRAVLTVRANPRPRPDPRPRPGPRPQPKPATPSPSAPLPVVTPPALSAPASGRGIFPITGPSSFGGGDGRFGAGRPGRLHQGQDIAAASGTPVVAPLSGVITTLAFQRTGAGQYAVMRAADGRSFFFAHMVAGSTSGLKVGQGVSAGQQLGQVGNSGISSGPHLHFEIWVGGWRINDDSRPVDPLPQLLAWKR